MDIISKRILDQSKVRAMCMKYRYCDCCDEERYNRVLSYCDERIATDSAVSRIADLIICYSDTDKLCYKYSCNFFELFESICFNIINECTYTTVKIDVRS